METFLSSYKKGSDRTFKPKFKLENPIMVQIIVIILYVKKFSYNLKNNRGNSSGHNKLSLLESVEKNGSEKNYNNQT